MPSHTRQQSTHWCRRRFSWWFKIPILNPFRIPFLSPLHEEMIHLNAIQEFGWVIKIYTHTQKRTFLDIPNIRMWLFSFFQSNFCVEYKQTAESKYPFINCLVAWVDVTKHFYQKCRQFLSKLFIPASQLKHSVNVWTRHVNSFLLFLHWSSAGLYGLTSCTKGGIGLVGTHTIIFPLLGN